ncbi:hypothetical protein [Halovivax limisalsi]|uniref:hypothetical protein n=1 Tax=Halovivax limisalsi TaxID=1453760 RepID=UPI001FFC8929|nr:hypothetical protein [Halovivax limisalsi]
MDSRRVVGACLVTIGIVGLLGLQSSGSLRHPVDAIAETGPVAYGAIGLAIVCVTVGLVVLLGSFVDAT